MLDCVHARLASDSVSRSTHTKPLLAQVRTDQLPMYRNEHVRQSTGGAVSADLAVVRNLSTELKGEGLGRVVQLMLLIKSGEQARHGRDRRGCPQMAAVRQPVYHWSMEAAGPAIPGFRCVKATSKSSNFEEKSAGANLHTCVPFTFPQELATHSV
jgi:hypothetical protein